MACGYGEYAKDCAALHWAATLGGVREGNAWRAPCPVCSARRALKFQAWGRGISWKSWCEDHGRATIWPVLQQMLPDCVPSRSPGSTSRIQPGEPTRLALSGLPTTALRVALLEMDGLTRNEAFDKLGVDRTTRYRIRTQLSQICDKTAGHR